MEYLSHWIWSYNSLNFIFFLLLFSDAIIKKDSMPLAKKVLKISPPVPRRMGWKGDNDESSVFHIKFKTESGRDEVGFLHN